MSNNQEKNTDKQMREAIRRVFPPFKRIFKDKSKFDRKEKHKRNNTDEF